MNPKIRINLVDGRIIDLELYPDKAPATVANFLKLIDEKFYDGIIFHRNIPNFMIQTGGYFIIDDTITEADDRETIKGEFTSNGFMANDINHEVGVISMARTNVKDSASTQFFICSANVPHLNGDYAAFGKTLNEESNKVVIDLSLAPTRNIAGHLADFPYPVIGIKNIIRL